MLRGKIALLIPPSSLSSLPLLMPLSFPYLLVSFPSPSLVPSLPYLLISSLLPSPFYVSPPSSSSPSSSPPTPSPSGYTGATSKTAPCLTQFFSCSDLTICPLHSWSYSSSVLYSTSWAKSSPGGAGKVSYIQSCTLFPIMVASGP